MKICNICGKPITKGQRFFNGPSNRGPAKHQTCSNARPCITDSERITFIERTITGTGASRFLKSVFLTTRIDGTSVLLDIKNHDVIEGENLRKAIDAAILENAIGDAPL